MNTVQGLVDRLRSVRDATVTTTRRCKEHTMHARALPGLSGAEIASRAQAMIDAAHALESALQTLVDVANRIPDENRHLLASGTTNDEILAVCETLSMRLAHYQRCVEMLYGPLPKM